MDTAAPAWVKSSHSFGAGNCVEVAALPGGAGVRDSRNPGGAVLRFPRSQWNAFLKTAKETGR